VYESNASADRLVDLPSGSANVRPSPLTDAYTFLFADLAGFTALTEAHGDEQAADLAHEFSNAAAELLPVHGAEQIKTIGDALMLRVGQPVEAVKLGLALTHDLLAECGYPTIRVGMHHGPAVQRAGDWFGATVNLAPRVSVLAHGGEVLLTDATRERAEEIEGVRFEAHGVHQLRNITEPVKVFSAVREVGARTDLRIDPVCRMAVAPDGAAGTLVHEGRSYYFCSLDCAARFAGDPTLYLDQEAQ
jgi:class 3 adenylate cyclase/YHS domain-containing protein